MIGHKRNLQIQTDTVSFTQVIDYSSIRCGDVGYVMVVETPELTSRGERWKNILQMFTWESLVLFTLAIAVASVILYWVLQSTFKPDDFRLKTHRGIVHCFMFATKAFLGQSLSNPELPSYFHRRFSRLILLLLLFVLSFFMSAIYKSTLFSFLSSPPKYSFLSSSNDLEASGRHWVTPANTVLTKAFQNRPVLDSKLIAIPMGEFGEYAFRMLEEPGKYVLVQTASPIFSLTWIGKQGDNIQRMEQLRDKYRWRQIWPFYISPVLVPQSVHIPFPKKSPLLPKMDATIATLIECGIRDALESGLPAALHMPTSSEPNRLARVGSHLSSCDLQGGQALGSFSKADRRGYVVTMSPVEGLSYVTQATEAPIEESKREAYNFAAKGD
ncbi:unnamed protein product [Cyprideis torosa]|uniref:Uncharacterized protein n=1 Tax=Cyprideis torosa TaxID=163714 RepID=A0A7R8WFM8_9CRUS|nr:unnamed protein product [Cyprideis torosa]CAG0897191.1 unnamed protein product [Cyprideis torosa]